MRKSREVEELQELGLNEREARVYLALLAERQAGAGTLLKRTGLYRVMLYDTLDALVKKGLVSFFELNSRRQYVAEPPEKLLDDLNMKESMAAELVGRLAKLGEGGRPSAEPTFRLYHGLQGVKSAQENYFGEMRANPKGEYLSVGASFALHERLDNFFNSFHEKRSKMGIRARILFNPDNRGFGELKKRFALTGVRYMPGNFMTPSWVSLYGDVLLLGVIDENPLAIFIRSGRMADSYRNYFELMWKLSKK